MHVLLTFFNLYEVLNTVFQCPIQIVECESLAIMETWDAKPGQLEALYVLDISQRSMSSIPIIREV